MLKETITFIKTFQIYTIVIIFIIFYFCNSEASFSEDYKLLSCKEPITKIIIYVESDGRHVVAINNKGEILWIRDPFEDAHLQPYRNSHPKIRGISNITKPSPWLQCCAEVPSDPYVAVGYDSSQYGMVDIRTGDFIFLGQN